MDQTSCQKALADGFYNEPAGNIIAFCDPSRDNCMLTPWENMGSIIGLLAEWTLKASGL